MESYLFGFGCEGPIDMECNDGEGTDYESSRGVFIEAASESEALAWGREIAEAFMKYEHAGNSTISWKALGYAHWIESDPENCAWSHCLSFFPRVKVGELPEFSRMTTRAYIEWCRANGMDV